MTKNQLEKLGKFDEKTSQILRELYNVADNLDEKREFLKGIIRRIFKLNHLALDMRNGYIPFDAKVIKDKNIENIKNDLPHWEMLKYDCAVCSSCGYTHLTGFNTTQEATEHWHELYKYCPECGTRMWSSFKKEED